MTCDLHVADTKLYLLLLLLLLLLLPLLLLLLLLLLQSCGQGCCPVA
jgi:hypothetical protein